MHEAVLKIEMSMNKQSDLFMHGRHVRLLSDRANRVSAWCMKSIFLVMFLLQFLNSKGQTTNVDTTINKLVIKVWMLDSCGSMGLRKELVPFLKEYMIGKSADFLVKTLGKPDWIDDQPLYSRFHFSVSAYDDPSCCCIKEKGFVLSTITFEFDRKTKKILEVEYIGE